MGVVKRAKRERVVDVEREREESGLGWILGVGLKGMRVFGGGGWWWWRSLAVVEARRAITTADE